MCIQKFSNTATFNDKMLDLFSHKKQEKIRREAAKNGVRVEIFLQSKYANKAAKNGYASVYDYLTARHAKKIDAKKKKHGSDTSSSSSSDSN